MCSGCIGDLHTGPVVFLEPVEEKIQLKSHFSPSLGNVVEMLVMLCSYALHHVSYSGYLSCFHKSPKESLTYWCLNILGMGINDLKVKNISLSEL